MSKVSGTWGSNWNFVNNFLILFSTFSENMGIQKQLRGGVRFVETMPRTSIGKMDRQYFKKLVKDELITDIVP